MNTAVAIIQARMGSTRLPGKVLKELRGHAMLWHIARRLRSVAGLTRIVIATSDVPGDTPLRDFAAGEGIDCYAGSENDVLDRFYQAAVQFQADPIVRVTGDCPFVDPDVIARLLDLYRTGGFDHVGVATGAGAVFMDGGRFPDGLDAECFSFQALQLAWREAREASDREHVTPYLWRVPGRFRNGTLKAEKDYADMRWTVDNADDFTVVRAVYNALYRDDRPFLMHDIIAFLEQHPEIARMNQAFIGKEGYRDVWSPNTQE